MTLEKLISKLEDKRDSFTLKETKNNKTIKEVILSL